MLIRPQFLTMLLVAATATFAVPSFAQAPARDGARDADIVEDDGQPHGDRWEDRWRGRKHILYDEMWQDGTDGHAVDLQGKECGQYPVRYRRADGTTAVRRDQRCD